VNDDVREVRCAYLEHRGIAPDHCPIGRFRGGVWPPRFPWERVALCGICRPPLDTLEEMRNAFRAAVT